MTHDTDHPGTSTKNNQHDSSPADAAPEVLLVLSNAPDQLIAKRIAHYLVEEGLAACVNLGGVMLSMYMWEGKLEGNEEIPLTIKTTRARLSDLVQRLIQLHPYEVPEVLVLPVIDGARPYLDWVAQQTTPV